MNAKPRFPLKLREDRKNLRKTFLNNKCARLKYGEKTLSWILFKVRFVEPHYYRWNSEQSYQVFVRNQLCTFRAEHLPPAWKSG